MSGFIYVMSNPSFADGLIKIGRSDRDPSTYRKHELGTTGVPLPFEVEYYAFVTDPEFVEQRVHIELSEYRRTSNREFFSCSIQAAIQKIREIAHDQIKFEEMFYQSEEEIQKLKEIEERKLQEEIQKKEHEDRNAAIQQRISQANKHIEAKLDSLYARSYGYINNEPTSLIGIAGDIFNGSVNYFTIYHGMIQKRYERACGELNAKYSSFKKEKMRLYNLRIDGSDLDRITNQDNEFLESCEKEMREMSERIKKKNKIPNRVIRRKW